ncbi:MAG: alkaline phosphatase [Clostridia bacterium]|nr:alkaline phosphatase [Clostridia bacterium]
MKKCYSRILSLLLALIMLFSLTACDPDTDTDISTESGTSADEATEGDNGTTDAGTDAPEEPEKIKNIILIIGDGMGKQHIQSGVLDRGSKYSFQSWLNTSANTDSVNTAGVGGVLTDSAAAATALATGTLTVNSYLGVDHQGALLETIMDHAAKQGKSTGIATTDNLYGATPAGFSAHCNNRNDYYTITSTQLQSGVNFLCGLHDYTYDQASYTSMIAGSPYYYTKSLNDEKIMSNDQVMLSLNIENGASDSVSLADVTKKALSYLERDEDGFVLMIEQAYIDKNAHNNNFPEMLKRMHSLGETVDAIMEWMGDREDTAVLITADHETGGLSVSDTIKYGNTYNGQNGPIYYKWTTTGHTKSVVSLYVYGFYTDFGELEEYKSDYLIKNTEIFDLMKKILDGNAVQ